MLTQQKVTLDDFIQFANQPENADRMFELINGEIVEKMPGRASNSAIAMKLGIKTGSLCEQNNLPYFISGEAGSCNVLGHVYMQDFAYGTIPLSTDYPEPIPPLWVAEVISPNDKPSEIRAKRLVYLEAGILYWEIYPEAKSIDVYTPPGQNVQTYRESDSIDLSALIPGFTLAVRDLFA
jgi:Uma2 family endonuclease